MKKSYQKWLLAAGIVAVVTGILYIVMAILVKSNNRFGQEITNFVYEALLLTSMTKPQNMVEYVSRTLLVGSICNLVVGVYMIFMAVRSTVMFYKRQSLLGIVVVVIVLFGDLSLIATILYVVAIIKANKRIQSTASMPKTSTQTKQYQLLNAKEYAKKLKELRDKGEITQEEFMAEIENISEVMTDLMTDISNEKDKENK